MFVARFTNILCKIMYNQYPMSYYWGTDTQTHGRTDARTHRRRFLNELRLRALAPGGARITRSVTAQFVGTTYISGSVPNIYVLKVRRTLTLMRTNFLGLIINSNEIENSPAHLKVND